MQLLISSKIPTCHVIYRHHLWYLYDLIYVICLIGIYSSVDFGWRFSEELLMGIVVPYGNVWGRSLVDLQFDGGDLAGTLSVT